MTVQPKDHISHLEVGWSPPELMISGAIQYGLPAAEIVFWFSYNFTATPKSASFINPFFVNNIFAPFISLWITYFLCKNTRPFNICFT